MVIMNETNCSGGTVITLLLNAFEQSVILPELSHVICKASKVYTDVHLYTKYGMCYKICW